MQENKHREEMEKDTLIKVSGMYKDWFLDYASYVILERAIPAVSDGLKPVQRRILHSMKELDDGRYNKVANIVGHTMQYHPHGDVSITDALVQVGQKNLLIDTQGNWGNTLTGDNAAAARYIEARLSKFALEVVYNSKITEWQLSYDGRKNEPISLPVKFPLLLVQGAEGIAVGLSTKILPHNFNELIQASIQYLKGRPFKLYPDFLTGGRIDIQNYKDGIRGSRVKIRAKIEIKDKKTLLIKEIPYSTTTGSLIDSIIKANDKGKIKIKKIEDNTSAEVEILIHLPNEISPDKTLRALYAFTNCEVSLSPLGCVIIDNKPQFIGVSEILKISTNLTVELHRKELTVKFNELQSQLHYAILEKIFIENKIYSAIENQVTWEGVLRTIHNGLKPFSKKFIREVTSEDLINLTEIKIRRISKYDSDKSNKRIESLKESLKQIRYDLDNLTEYVIKYFQHLKTVYGKALLRKSIIEVFDDVDAKKVVARNIKLYVNRKDGFIGTGMRKFEYVSDCSDIDDIIVITETGKMRVVKVDSKVFIGNNIIHVSVFNKGDERTIYNLIYRDGASGISHIKRFPITGLTRDKEYDLTKGSPKSKILYLSVNPNGEAEIVNVILRSTRNIRKTRFEYDFSQVALTSRGARGRQLTKQSINKIVLKSEGKSTLKARKLWFDPVVNRLNVDARGQLLGEFEGGDKIVQLHNDRELILMSPNLDLHFTKTPLHLRKYNPRDKATVVYHNPAKSAYYIKLFDLSGIKKSTEIIPEKCTLNYMTFEEAPTLRVKFRKQRNKPLLDDLIVDVESEVSQKSFSAMGRILSKSRIHSINIESSVEEQESTSADKNPDSKSEESIQSEISNEGVQGKIPFID